MLTTLGNNVTELGQPLSGIQGVEYDATTWVLPSNDVNGILIPNNVVIPSLYNDLYPVISQNMYPSGKNVSVLDQSYLVPVSSDTTVIVDSYWTKIGTILTPKISGTSINVDAILLKNADTIIGVDVNGNITFKDSYYTTPIALKDLIGGLYTAGDGILITTIGSAKIISNTKPDVTVTLTSSDITKLEVTGTYPDFTLIPKSSSVLTAGTNITILNDVISSTDITIVDETGIGVISNVTIDPLNSHNLIITREDLVTDYILKLAINSNTPNDVPTNSIIKFIAGTGITLAQTGTDITINSEGGLYIPNSNFTATTHTVGALPAGTLNTSITGLTFSDIINKMLYKDILASFVVPSLSTVVSLSTVITSSGTYLEKGITKNVTLASNFSVANYNGSVNSTGTSNAPQPYAIVSVPISYTLNTANFTSGTDVIFNDTKTIVGNLTYISNPDCNQKSSTGTIINASSFTGYPSNRLLATTNIYYAVNPIYYGIITGTNASVWTSGFNDSATWAKIKATTKYIGPNPGTVTNTFSPYSGAVLPTNWIVIASPYQVKDIINKATGYSEFANYTEIADAVYTRLDSVTEAIYVYYASNKFTTTAGTDNINLTIKF